MKKIRLIAMALLLALMLSACDVYVELPGFVDESGEPAPDPNKAQPNEGNENANDKTEDKEENNTPVVNDDITFDIGEQVMIIVNDAEENRMYRLQQVVADVTGFWAITMTDDYAEKNNELCFGKCDRPVSKDAYKYLESYERETKHTARYAFYSYGNSIAIAFDEDFGYEDYIVQIAIDSFTERYFKEGEPMNIPAGELYIGTIDLLAYQKERDEKRKEEAWANFEKVAGTETAEALKEMYETLYSDKLVDWFANLYDVDHGGYYYSNSARDDYQALYNGAYYDLLPDIESTAQALGFITSSGMAYGLSGLREALPEWMQISIIKFMKERQDPSGYFYHPQWTKAMVDSQLSRRGRDLGNAVSVINQLGAKPTYSTPIGSLSDGTLWDGTPVAAAQSKLTLPIDASVAVSVSLVVATASATVPSHLQDDVSFRTYLKNFEDKNGKIDSNSYWIGNQLASQANQIVARDKTLAKENRGYSLVDILVEWLDGHCYETTGHWSSKANYDGLNGLMKISAVYEAVKRPLPYPEAAVRSAIATIDTTETNSTVCFCYNSWFAIRNIIGNVSTHKPMAEANEIVGSIREELRARAPELIRATMQKQGIFLREDGSFSYTVNGPAAQSQGMPVVSKVYPKEGDVNATVICTTGTLGQMFSVLGYSSVPILYRSDLIRYIDIIEENLENTNDKYNYAETESQIDPDRINFKISTHTNSETGVTAPVIKIYNSINYTDEREQKEILRHIFNTPEGRAARLSEADLEYYLDEWKVHNYMYDNPNLVSTLLGMSVDDVKNRAKHVDLNTNDERKSTYETIAKMIK